MRYGWKLNMYLKQASEIFANRPKAWILKCPVAVESREITKKFRSIDRMCFSAQFYFVAAHITFGCLLSVYGLMVVINGGYEIFKDHFNDRYKSYTLEHQDVKKNMASFMASIALDRLPDKFSFDGIQPIYVRNKVAQTIDERK